MPMELQHVQILDTRAMPIEHFERHMYELNQIRKKYRQNVQALNHVNVTGPACGNRYGIANTAAA